jgi:iron(III) transport system permease protein
MFVTVRSVASLRRRFDARVAPPWLDALRFRRTIAAVMCSVVLGVVALLVVYPIVLLLINSLHVGLFGRETHWGFDNWLAAITEPALVSAIWNTIALAVTRQAISLILAIGIAWLLVRTDLPGARWLELGFWTTVFLPTLTVLVAWIMVFNSFNGVANELLKRLPFVHGPVFDIFSWWGIVATHLLSGTLAIKVMLLTPAFRNLDAALEEASLVSGASTLGTLARVVVPLLAPAILVVTILSTIRAFESFEIELVLGSPSHIDVFSTRIYSIARREPPEYGIATALSMAILVLMLPAIVFQQWYSGRRSHATLGGKFVARVTRLRRWRWPLFGMVLAMVLFMTILPTALVVMGTFMTLFGFFGIPEVWTLKNWQTALNSSALLSALANTLIIAGGGSLVAMSAFTVIAYITVRTRFAGRGLLDLLVWLPSTVPGIILSLGFLWLFLGTPFLRPLYGTTFVLILVTALGSITLGTQLTKASLLQLGAELEEASRAAGASWAHTFRYVVLPLIAPTIAVVGVIAFASAARATGQVALLSTQSNRPLSMLQLSLLATNEYGAASVVGVILLVLTAGVALVARSAGLRVDQRW